MIKFGLNVLFIFMLPYLCMSQDSSDQASTSISNNPNISVIGDFESYYSNTGSRKFDLFFNEAEFTFNSFVDPYAKADIFLSFAKNTESGKYEVDLEEAYITTLDLPYGLQLRAGKFRMAFGKINSIHPHALPFIDLPAIYENYLGESLNDAGLSASWIIPNPLDFYQELTFELTSGNIETPTFYHNSSSKYLMLVHLKNFWDLSDNSTFELGLSGINGPNKNNYSTSIGGLDLTYKWKPLRYNTYHSFQWQTEILFCKKKLSKDISTKSVGFYSFITYQLSRRWFLTGRVDYSNTPDYSSTIDRAISGTVGWYATEFQKIEFQLSGRDSNYQPNSFELWMRWIFVIGSHAAHQY
ncbi:MAG: hypothetical protein HZB59_06135 [Ignavibacteriales bacterium]|nr:hypothetical protein [Ignavibacteriales bacterium]